MEFLRRVLNPVEGPAACRREGFLGVDARIAGEDLRERDRVVAQRFLTGGQRGQSIWRQALAAVDLTDEQRAALHALHPYSASDSRPATGHLSPSSPVEAFVTSYRGPLLKAARTPAAIPALMNAKP